jgi:hypothetical protein
MAQAGLDSIEIAKQNGSWTIMDDAQAMVVPPDLEAAFEKRPNANSYFLSLCKSDKRSILQWLVQAKRSETRQKRITEIIEQGDQNLKPKAFNGPKSQPMIDPEIARPILPPGCYPSPVQSPSLNRRSCGRICKTWRSVRMIIFAVQMLTYQVTMNDHK